VHLTGTEVTEVLVSDPNAGARRIEPGAQGDVVEVPLEARLLGGEA
jgi:hypothetical protein